MKLYFHARLTVLFLWRVELWGEVARSIIHPSFRLIRPTFW